MTHAEFYAEFCTLSEAAQKLRNVMGSGYRVTFDVGKHFGSTKNLEIASVCLYLENPDPDNDLRTIFTMVGFWSTYSHTQIPDLVSQIDTWLAVGQLLAPS
jgi:hypothetical protein